jgi:thioredoxin reductase
MSVAADGTAGPYDIVVVGAGAAGLAAATLLGRCGRGVLVVGPAERANSPAAAVRNLPYADGIAPADLYAAMEGEATRAGVRLVTGEVDDVGPDADGGLRVRVGGADVRAARLLIAVGTRQEVPAWVPAARWGTTVFDCPFCHAADHAGEAFVVAGKSRVTVESALLCVAQAGSMTVLLTDPAAAAGAGADRLRTLGAEVVLDTVVRADPGPAGGLDLHTAAGRRLSAGAVLLPGLVRTRRDLTERLGLKADDAGVPETDAEGRSSHPAVWVAGTAARPERMVVESMGSGIRAAVSLHRDLAVPD